MPTRPVVYVNTPVLGCIQLPRGGSTDLLRPLSQVGVSLDVPVHGGKLGMGTWQGLYLADFTGAACAAGRELVVTITQVSVPG
jgi:hypothetical protein